MTKVANTYDAREVVAPDSKYRGYTVRLVGDCKQPARYCNDGPRVVRVFYRVVRIPSRRLFQVQLMPGATPQERAWVSRTLHLVPSDFEMYEEAYALKRRSPSGEFYYWSLVMGFPLDDPMMQLELEMMIDQDQDVHAR